MRMYKGYAKTFRIVAEPTTIHKAQMKQSEDVQKYARQIYDEGRNSLAVCEYFYIILLNRANNTVGWQLISQGGVAGTVADPKLIAKISLDSLASSIILVHNHPSGEIKPSQNDIDLTKKLKGAMKLLDIQVLDHIILSPDRDRYYSFADEGLM